MKLDEFSAFYREICRFDVAFGLELTVLDAGRIEYRLTIEERHLSMSSYCHGGTLAAMMDSTLGLTALSRIIPQRRLCQTVEFKINYFATPHLGDRLLGTGEVEFLGRSTVVSSAKIINPDKQLVIAKGLGTFSTYPLERRADEIGLAARWLASDDPAHD